MRLSKEEYHKRILLVVGQYMRLRDQKGLSHEQIDVRRMTILNGFTYNFSKVEKLQAALQLTYYFIWENRYKNLHSCGKAYTPCNNDILNFVLSKLK